MHKVTAKRQVTIPIELCRKAHIEPGDMVEIFEYEGRVTVIKKELGAAAGVIKHLKGDAYISDDASRQDALEKKHPAKKKRAKT